MPVYTARRTTLSATVKNFENKKAGSKNAAPG
jgi:hypothetical protein